MDYSDVIINSLGPAKMINQSIQRCYFTTESFFSLHVPRRHSVSDIIDRNDGCRNLSTGHWKQKFAVSG